MEKIKSIIISIYICYYIRLIDKKDREKFDKDEIKNNILKLINLNCQKEKKNSQGLFNLIYNEELYRRYKKKWNK